MTVIDGPDIRICHHAYALGSYRCSKCGHFDPPEYPALTADERRSVVEFWVAGVFAAILGLSHWWRGRDGYIAFALAWPLIIVSSVVLRYAYACALALVFALWYREDR